MKKALLFFALSFWLLSSLAGAGEGKIKIKGDVRVLGLDQKNPPQAVVEYRGPCGIKRPSTVVHLWKDRVLDVTLWLTSDAPDGDLADPEEIDVSIRGVKCEFWPRLLVVRPGTTINISNNDTTTQWYIIEEGGRKRQVMQDPEGPPVRIDVGTEEIHVFSAFYSWMEAWIKPVPNLIATTETEWDGLFYFREIPAGEYTLHAWNRALGETSQPITVTDNERTKAKVEFDNPANTPFPVIKPSMLEELFGIDKHENPFKH